jgi:hypothetical protein
MRDYVDGPVPLNAGMKTKPGYGWVDRTVFVITSKIRVFHTLLSENPF